MTIKIIKRGTRNPEMAIYEIKCGNCECVFQFQRTDATFNVGTQKEGDSLTIGCPECKRRCFIELKNTEPIGYVEPTNLAEAYYDK